MFFNSEIVVIAVFCVVGYFLGSVDFAILISTIFYGRDIREYGSSNAGTTNVWRTFGKMPAVLTFLGDFIKGIVSIVFCDFMFLVLFEVRAPIYSGILVGVFALMGHVFPIFYKFKGGKGVAVSAGVLLTLDWTVFLLVVFVFFIFFLISKIVSLSSIFASMSYPIFVFLKYLIFGSSVWEFIVRIVAAIFICFMVVFMHRSNIKRLIDGTGV